MRASIRRGSRTICLLLNALALVGSAAVAPLRAQASGSPAAVTREALATALDALRSTEDGVKLPASDAFTFGDATVAAGSTHRGTIAIANGTLHVRGLLDGSAVTYRGDVIVHEGGEVRGDAIAILGKVTLNGGRVGGDVRATGGNLARIDSGTAGAAYRPGNAMVRSLALAAAWLVVLSIVGIGVLVFASSNLDAVSDTLEHHFGRSFVAGIVGQLALLPALAVLLVALTLTVLGILLIPFAVVAYVLAAAGIITLGYLAIARITGGTFVSRSGTSERERRLAALRALLVGLVIVMSPWLVAALLASSPRASLVAQTMAVVITWVAGTAGLGATLVSRGGVRRRPALEAQRAMTSSSWQTPTPVAGISAARRPTPSATTVQK